MKGEFPRRPDLIDITADECHALWFAFQAVEESFVGYFFPDVDTEFARHFGRGFRRPGTKESFVPAMFPVIAKLYVVLAELGREALPRDPEMTLICKHAARDHHRLLADIVAKLEGQ